MNGVKITNCTYRETGVAEVSVSSQTFTLAQELRFLSLQCHAQAETGNRDEDEAFLENLFGALRSIAPNFALIYRDTLTCSGHFGFYSPVAMIRIAGRDLVRLAADLDRLPSGRAT